MSTITPNNFMFDTFKNRLELTGTLTTVTALRISAGRSSEPIGTDLPVIKDAFGRPFIPGSSFKGALRSRLESFLRGINIKLAANPAIEEEWSITFKQLEEIKDKVDEDIKQILKKDRKAKVNKDEMLSEEILAQTDLASRLFGSPWIASKFQVRDLMVKPDTWFGQYQERDGVAIERDTETAAEGKLYDYQVVPAGTFFDFHAIVENAEEYELGLLMIGLHQFESEQIPLGGGRSRGLGVVRLEIEKMWWFDYPENKPTQLLDYIKRLVQEVDGGKDHYLCDPEQIKILKREWTESLINKLQTEINEVTNTQIVKQE